MTLLDPRLVRSLAVAALLLTFGAEHLSAQRLRGRTLRSPGRGASAPAAPVNPSPAVVTDSAGARLESLFSVAVSPSPLYTLKLTPSVDGDGESNTYGAQLLVERGRINAGLTGKMAHTDATDRLDPAVQGDVEFGLLEERRRMGLPTSLTVGGAVLVTRREGNEALATAVADVRLLGDGEERFSISLQGLGNYGVSWASGGESRSGASFGAGMSVHLRKGLDAEAEYGFDSSYAEEDSWEARVLLDLPRRRVQPTLTVGAGKHGTFQVGLQLAREIERQRF